MNEELWKEVPGYPLYWISSHGRTWSEKTKTFLKSHNASQTDFHQKIKLSNNGQSQKFFVHRLVMLAFCPIERPEKFQVNHIDGNPLNNALENLEWVTEKQNHQHYKEKILPKLKEEGKCVLGKKPNIIKIEFENGQINYYVGLEEACAHLKISKSTFARWKEAGSPVKISYIEFLPENHFNSPSPIQKKSIPRAVKIKYKDYEKTYENGREADRDLGLKEGTVNLWAKRETNKQTPTMRKLNILRVEFI